LTGFACPNPLEAKTHKRNNPKIETDLTTDCADDTDTIGYDYQCPEVLPRKDSYVHPHNLLKICEIGGICGFNFGI
jgi:hypothetical protein